MLLSTRDTWNLPYFCCSINPNRHHEDLYYSNVALSYYSCQVTKGLHDLRINIQEWRHHERPSSTSWNKDAVLFAMETHSQLFQEKAKRSEHCMGWKTRLTSDGLTAWVNDDTIESSSHCQVQHKLPVYPWNPKRGTRLDAGSKLHPRTRKKQLTADTMSVSGGSRRRRPSNLMLTAEKDEAFTFVSSQNSKWPRLRDKSSRKRVKLMLLKIRAICYHMRTWSQELTVTNNIKENNWVGDTVVKGF